MIPWKTVVSWMLRIVDQDHLVSFFVEISGLFGLNPGLDGPAPPGSGEPGEHLWTTHTSGLTSVVSHKL